MRLRPIELYANIPGLNLLSHVDEEVCTEAFVVFRTDEMIKADESQGEGICLGIL